MKTKTILTWIAIVLLVILSYKLTAFRMRTRDFIHNGSMPAPTPIPVS